jgi:hypothetical protein
MTGPLDRLTKLDSRLRCVANGATEVNAIRAEQNGAVRLKPGSRQAMASSLAIPVDGESLKSLGRTFRSTLRPRLSSHEETAVSASQLRRSPNSKS